MSGPELTVAIPSGGLYPGAVTPRACLRLLLLAALLLAPLGRISVAQAAPPAAGMTMAHCGEMPAGHDRQAPAPDKERMAVDCLIACAAMAPPPAPLVTPPPAGVAPPATALISSLNGIQPEADPPPPRFS